jgi:hypothetical protein
MIMITTNSTPTKAVTAVIECDANEHPYGITLSFANGKTLTLMETNLSGAMRARALWHGVSAKLVDATAISRNPDTGRSASVEDKYNAAREVYERLLAGQWNKVRGDGTGTGSGGLLFRALCITYPTKTPEQIRAYLATKNLSEQATMRKSDKLATIIEDLRAKDAANGEPVDEEALFEGLED